MVNETPETLLFLNADQVRALATEFGTPLFVYSEAEIIKSIEETRRITAPYGLTVRYAMKANPNANILRLFHSLGVHIDASSGYEVERALRAGIPAQEILITSQETAHNLAEVIQQGVLFDACSFHQLKNFGELFPGSECGVRINPGLGSGGTKRTTTGGASSSFGIWHEQIDEVLEQSKKYNLKIVRVHTHIGSGTDPEVWKEVAAVSADLLLKFPEARTLNLGGGFKVARMAYESSADMAGIGERVTKVIEDFKKETGRTIQVEIEPGTFLIARSGSLITTVDAVKTTGKDGYRHYVVNGGMTEVTRPALYGAQHPLVTVSKSEVSSALLFPALVAGHCCESGDVLTPAPGNPEGLLPRLMEEASEGDFIVVEGVGAYCASMSTKNYNSFPEAPEVMISRDGRAQLIRKRQTLDQILVNEL